MRTSFCSFKPTLTYRFNASVNLYRDLGILIYETMTSPFLMESRTISMRTYRRTPNEHICIYQLNICSYDSLASSLVMSFGNLIRQKTIITATSILLRTAQQRRSATYERLQHARFL